MFPTKTVAGDALVILRIVVWRNKAWAVDTKHQ